MTENWHIPTRTELSRIVAMMDDRAFYDQISRVPDTDLQRALAGDDDIALWVYRVDGRAVAYAFMTDMATTLPKLDEFAVFERGRGFGKAALAALAQKCAQTPRYEKLWLYVVDGNEAALGLYRSLGFGDEEFMPKRWKTRSGKVVDQFRMWFDLDRLR